MLFSDATIITETPPLRASWAKRGEQAEVPITGNRSKRILYGALNPKTGALCLDQALRWNQDSFQAHMRHLRRLWGGWRIVLLLDRGSPHRARRSRQVAQQLGIRLRYLPRACPELNPVEGLWRFVKGRILANEPTPSIDASVERACEALQSLSFKERLQTAGTLSDKFWLPT